MVRSADGRITGGDEMTLENRISLLNDATAVELLQRFARGQPRAPVPDTLDSTITEQLRGQLNLTSDPPETASQGDVARTALLIVASDSDHRTNIEAMLNNQPAEKFAIIETALIVSAVLIALQTHVRFERDKLGKWAVSVEKKPTNSTLLTKLIKKLLAFS
jgi:hypothetical protein